MNSETSGIVLLAGSMEARTLSDNLVAQGHRLVILVTETPRSGQAKSMAHRLCRDIVAEDVIAAAKEVQARGILDAAHGFDARASNAGWAAAQQLELPMLRFARPLWRAESPRWRRAGSVVAAMRFISPGARVFSATGWDSLPEYADFPGARLLLRQTRETDRKTPFPFVEPVFGVPPFTVESELQLFEGMGVDLLICRNLGGAASRPKLDAALRLGLDVILVDPPARPAALRTVATVDEAMEWATTL